MDKNSPMGKVPVEEKVENPSKCVEITYVNQNAYRMKMPPVVDKSVDNVENCGLFAPIFPVLPDLQPGNGVHKGLHNRKKYGAFSCYVARIFHKKFGAFSRKKLELPKK